MNDSNLTPMQCLTIITKVAVCVFLAYGFPYIAIFATAVVNLLDIWIYFSVFIVLLLYCTTLLLMFTKDRRTLVGALLIIWVILILACGINYVIKTCG